MNDQNPILVAFGIVAFVGALAFLLLFRIDQQAVIEARWWTFHRSYTYTTTTTRPVSKTYTSTDANGKTTTETKIELVTETETHTRCRAQSVGHSLPPTPPQMPCDPHSGDHTSDSVSYVASYHESEDTTTKQLTIHPSAWFDFDPGKVIDVKLTLWGYVVKYDVKNQILAG
jgi:hypothetical protein